MKKIIRKNFPCKADSIPEAVDLVKAVLDKRQIDTQECAESLAKFRGILEGIVGKAASGDECFSIRIIKLIRRTAVTIQYNGTDEISALDMIPDTNADGISKAARRILDARLLSIMADRLRIRSSHGMNSISFVVNGRKRNMLVLNLFVTVLGILAGLLLKHSLPENVSVFFAGEILGTVITVFFNLLKMIVAPLVFFSIISGMSGFNDLNELRRISFRTIAYFLGFSIMGLFLGLGAFAILPVGDPSMMKLADFTLNGKAIATVSPWGSFKSLILSIFPSNLLGAFVNNEILAVIFLAVIIGITTGRMESGFAQSLNRGTEIMNELFCKLATTIVKAMPFIIFCSVCKLVIMVEFAEAFALLKLIGTVLIGILTMFVIYYFVLLFNGISPKEFFHGYSSALISAVTLASSSATVPISLKCCTDNLKISPMITYFVIPLGSTINMNGSCIIQTIICLFTARVFGITPTVSMMVPVLCMILLLSIAAPGVPGSLLIMLATILPMMGIPGEAVELTICVSTFIGMMIVPANCTGDAVVAMLVQKQEQKRAEHA